MREGNKVKMDIDKIINSYQSKVNAGDDNPEKVAQAKDETLNKVKNVSVLASLLDNIRTAYDLVSDSVTGRYKGVSKSTITLLAGGLAYLALPIERSTGISRTRVRRTAFVFFAFAKNAVQEIRGNEVEPKTDYCDADYAQRGQDPQGHALNDI